MISFRSDSRRFSLFFETEIKYKITSRDQNGENVSLCWNPSVYFENNVLSIYSLFQSAFLPERHNVMNCRTASIDTKILTGFHPDRIKVPISQN